MPAVKPAKVMQMVIPTVLATIESLEGSPTEVLFTSVARKELSIVVVGVLAGGVFGRVIEDVLVRVLAGDVFGRVIEDVVVRAA